MRPDKFIKPACGDKNKDIQGMHPGIDHKQPKGRKQFAVERRDQLYQIQLLAQVP